MASTMLRPLWVLAGGSFNPITNQHLRMFERAKEHIDYHPEFGLKVVKGIVSPVNDAYGYKSNLLSSDHRVKMCQLAVQDISQAIDWLEVDDWEAQKSEWTRTVDVLRHFQQELDRDYGSDDSPKKPLLRLLCGGDLLESFSQPGVWEDRHIEEIVGKFGLIVMTRMYSDPHSYIDKHPILKRHKEDIIVVKENIGGEDVSATKVREALQKQLKLTFFMQPSVLQYIQDHQLYKQEIVNPGKDTLPK